MKFYRKKGDTSSIRKVYSDDKEVFFGLVGQVNDFLKVSILEYCSASPDTWAFIPALGIMQKAVFGETREEVLAHLPDM